MFNHARFFVGLWIFCFVGTVSAQGVPITVQQENRYYLTVHGGNLEYSLANVRAENERANFQRFALVETANGGWFRIVSVQTGASFDANGGTEPYWRAKEISDDANRNLLFRFQDIENVRDGKFLVPFVADWKVFDANNANGKPYFYEGGDVRNRNHVWYMEKDGDEFRLFVVLSKEVPLVEQMYVDDRPCVVILIHGVSQNGRERSTWAEFPAWAARALGKAEVIPFDYSEGDPIWAPEASIRIGHRADQVEGQPDKGWQGAGKLKELVGRIRHEKGESVRISVVAYSLGSVVTLSAMQEGLPVDNVIFMGSPLFGTVIENASDGCDLAEGMKYVSGKLINMHSKFDDVVGGLLGSARFGTKGVGIGHRGLPDNIKHIGGCGGPPRAKQWQDGRIYDLKLVEIDHYDREGWWDRPWRVDGDWPSEFPKAKLAFFLGSNSAWNSPVESFSNFAVGGEFHANCKEGFGDGAKRSGAEWTFHMTKDMIQGFHFDDKDIMDYEIEVQTGSVKYDILHATWDKWEKDLGFDGPVLKASISEPEKKTFKSENLVHDATFWLRVQALEDQTKVRVKAGAKNK